MALKDPKTGRVVVWLSFRMTICLFHLVYNLPQPDGSPWPGPLPESEY